MSTYAAAEAALAAVVRLLDSGNVFTTDNCRQGDYRALDAQGALYACVLTKAGRSEYGDNLGNGRGAHGKRQQRHRIGVLLFRKRRQDADGEAYTDLTTQADAVVGLLDTYPRLNNTSGVKRAEVVESGEVRVRRDSPWIFLPLLVEVLTETEPSLVESPR